MNCLGYALLVLGCVSIGGCGVVPVGTSIPLPADTSPEYVFACAERVTRALHEENGHWDPRVTRRDIGRGIIEVGEYGEWNHMGYRYRLEVKSNEKARVHLRATSLYLTDLGARGGVAELRTRIERCLAADAAIRRTQ